MFRCIRTPPCITCWILLLLNLHCMWPCRNLSLLFMHCIILGRTLQICCSYIYVACVCSKILLLLFYIFIYTSCTSFLLLVLYCRYGKTGMACPLQYTFLTSKPVSGIKMGDNRLLLWQQCCHANQSFASLEGGSRQKVTTSDIIREGQKRDILSETLF